MVSICASSPGRSSGSATTGVFQIFLASVSIPLLAALGRTHLLKSYLLKHPANADQVVVENLPGRVEQLKDGRVADGIVDIRPLFAGRHNPLIAQHAELLGGVGGF